MTTATQRVTFEIIHEPAHYSRVCGCNIPEAFTAFVYIDDEPLPKWPCGDTREEAVANVQREWPGAKEL